MATATELKNIANEIGKLAQDLANGVTTAIDKAAQDKLAIVLKQLDKLTNKNGVFSANSKTLKEALKAIRLIDDLGSDPQLKAALNKFTTGFDKIAALNNSYINAAFGINTKAALAEDLTASALDLVSQTLQPQVVRYAIGNQMVATVRSAIYARGTITDVEDALKNLVLGTGGNTGIADRQIALIARDSVFQYNRDYLNAISAGLDIEYYLYAGSEIASSRPFCAQRHDKIYSKAQVLSWNKLDWQGKKPGDIFSNVGGYNCRHRLIPYPAELVKNT